MYSSKGFTIHLILTTTPWVCIPILWMRKLRSSEIKWFAKDYKASKWQIHDLNPQRLAPEHALLTTAIHKVPCGHVTFNENFLYYLDESCSGWVWVWLRKLTCFRTNSYKLCGILWRLQRDLEEGMSRKFKHRDGMRWNSAGGQY